jgi:hypothetical protein
MQVHKLTHASLTPAEGSITLFANDEGKYIGIQVPVAVLVKLAEQADPRVTRIELVAPDAPEAA